jgi:hypothetical protein
MSLRTRHTHTKEYTMIRKGTEISWKWGSGHAKGRVRERHESTIERTINGSQITRHGTPDNPALIIEQSDGQSVLKLMSEVERA